MIRPHFNKLIALVALCFCGSHGMGQSAQQWEQWGDAAMRNGDHYGASRFYREALDREPGRMALQWSFAEAARLSQQYAEAAEYYATVARKDIGRFHPEALRWAAEMHMSNGAYAEAEELWKKVKDKEKDPYSVTSLRATNALEGCRMAKDALSDTSTLRVDHLSEPVNSYDSEFAARVHAGDLYLTSLRGEVNDQGEVQDTNAYFSRVYRSHGPDTAWSAPEPLDAMVNGPGDNANSAWSVDGKYYYFTRCIADLPCRIFVRSNPYGAAKPLEGIGEGSSTQPMVASLDGHEVMFFTSDRSGGSGGLDIWRGMLDGERVAAVRPVGAPVNTPGNESCAWYAGDRLLFSSDHLPGFGSFDIFTSPRMGDDFGTPRNMGRPINSPANDLYPWYNDVERNGMFTSNRKGSLAKKGETCCNDIYAFHYPTTKPVVLETQVDSALVTSERRLVSLREKLPLRLYFHNDEPDPRSWDTLTALDYRQTYSAYKARTTDYYAAHGMGTPGQQAIDRFFLEHVDAGAQKLEQFIALLREAMVEGQRIELKVRGFASPLAKSDYNKNLSLRRISSMVNYFRQVDQGFFIPYLEDKASNGGALVVVKAPFGEDRSASEVSDVLNDLKNSVYSVSAAMERRIEIEQVYLSPEESNVIEVVRDTIDLGELSVGTEKDVRFELYNASKATMKLLGSKADCGCTTAELTQLELAPGERMEVPVHFNGRAAAGPLLRTITITTDGDPSELHLVIRGHMVNE